MNCECSNQNKGDIQMASWRQLLLTLNVLSFMMQFESSWSSRIRISLGPDQRFFNIDQKRNNMSTRRREGNEKECQADQKQPHLNMSLMKALWRDRIPKTNNIIQIKFSPSLSHRKKILRHKQLQMRLLPVSLGLDNAMRNFKFPALHNIGIKRV